MSSELDNLFEQIDRQHCEIESTQEALQSVTDNLSVTTDRIELVALEAQEEALVLGLVVLAEGLERLQDKVIDFVNSQPVDVN